MFIRRGPLLGTSSRSSYAKWAQTYILCTWHGVLISACNLVYQTASERPSPRCCDQSLVRDARLGSVPLLPRQSWRKRHIPSRRPNARSRTGTAALTPAASPCNAGEGSGAANVHGCYPTLAIAPCKPHGNGRTVGHDIHIRRRPRPRGEGGRRSQQRIRAGRTPFVRGIFDAPPPLRRYTAGRLRLPAGRNPTCRFLHSLYLHSLSP